MSVPRPNCAACRQQATLFPFTMAFQPVVDVDRQVVDSHEALVRGLNGESAATMLARVTDENRYAFDQACRVKAIELAARAGLEGALNINFLPKAVYEPRACIRTTLESAARHAFPPERLTFEFTENEAILDKRHLLAIIAEYRRHGIRIALDDFGTGYSGLARLADLRPDIVKLDRSLVSGCDRDKVRLAITRAVAALGRDIGTKVVAEGVERREEAEALRGVGISLMQGFYFGRPVPEACTQATQIPWLEAAWVPPRLERLEAIGLRQRQARSTSEDRRHGRS